VEFLWSSLLQHYHHPLVPLKIHLWTLQSLWPWFRRWEVGTSLQVWGLCDIDRRFGGEQALILYWQAFSLIHRPSNICPFASAFEKRTPNSDGVRCTRRRYQFEKCCTWSRRKSIRRTGWCSDDSVLWIATPLLPRHSFNCVISYFILIQLIKSFRLNLFQRVVLAWGQVQHLVNFCVLLAAAEQIYFLEVLFSKHFLIFQLNLKEW